MNKNLIREKDIHYYRQNMYDFHVYRNSLRNQYSLICLVKESYNTTLSELFFKTRLLI